MDYLWYLLSLVGALFREVFTTKPRLDACVDEIQIQEIGCTIASR
jgi:hypothetical protein